MKPWEKDLIDSSRDFVATACPELPEGQRIEVAQKVFRAMRKALKLFKDPKKAPPPSEAPPK